MAHDPRGCLLALSAVDVIHHPLTTQPGLFSSVTAITKPGFYSSFSRWREGTVKGISDDFSSKSRCALLHKCLVLHRQGQNCRVLILCQLFKSGMARSIETSHPFPVGIQPTHPSSRSSTSAFPPRPKRTSTGRLSARRLQARRPCWRSFGASTYVSPRGLVPFRTSPRRRSGGRITVFDPPSVPFSMLALERVRWDQLARVSQGHI